MLVPRPDGEVEKPSVKCTTLRSQPHGRETHRRARRIRSSERFATCRRPRQRQKQEALAAKADDAGAERAAELRLRGQILARGRSGGRTRGGGAAAGARQQNDARSAAARGAAEATEQGVPTPRTAAGIPFVPRDAWKSRPLKQAAELREQGVEFGPQFMFEREQKRQAQAEEKHGGAFRLRGQGAEEQLAEFRVRLEQLYGSRRSWLRTTSASSRTGWQRGGGRSNQRRGRPAREPAEATS